MSEWEPLRFKDYKWIVSDPALLGGKLTVRGTRLSVSFILSCLAEGMGRKKSKRLMLPFPLRRFPRIMKVASELLDTLCVAA